MKIAITSQGPTLDYELDPRFGRCKYFLFVDSETLEFTAKENPFIDASGGAGPQAGQLVISEKPDLIITGNLGPKAETALSTSGIKYITNAQGNIKDIVEQHKNWIIHMEPEYPIEKSSNKEIIKVQTEIIPQNERPQNLPRDNKTAELVASFVKGFIQGCFDAFTDTDFINKKTSERRGGRGKRKRSGKRMHKNR